MRLMPRALVMSRVATTTTRTNNRIVKNISVSRIRAAGTNGFALDPVPRSLRVECPEPDKSGSHPHSRSRLCKDTPHPRGDTQGTKKPRVDAGLFILAAG
jgi:hypothetical protein